MNAKRKGSRNEHKTIALLEKQGFSCCRAAASLGAWDIIAVSPARVLLVQVKSNRRPGRAEMDRLRVFKAPMCCVAKQLWIWKDRVAVPVIIPIETVEGGDLERAVA